MAAPRPYENKEMKINKRPKDDTNDNREIAQHRRRDPPPRPARRAAQHPPPRPNVNDDEHKQAADASILARPNGNPAAMHSATDIDNQNAQSEDVKAEDDELFESKPVTAATLGHYDEVQEQMARHKRTKAENLRERHLAAKNKLRKESRIAVGVLEEQLRKTEIARVAYEECKKKEAQMEKEERAAYEESQEKKARMGEINQTFTESNKAINRIERKLAAAETQIADLTAQIAKDQQEIAKLRKMSVNSTKTQNDVLEMLRKLREDMGLLEGAIVPEDEGAETKNDDEDEDEDEDEN